MDSRLGNVKTGNGIVKMQNLLKKGRAGLNRSRSELGDHNKRILRQITRHRPEELREQNPGLLASFRIKEIQSLTKLAIFTSSSHTTCSTQLIENDFC